jgi:hypothetical protein
MARSSTSNRGGTGFHLERSEPPIAPFILAALCAVVAVGRYKLAPIAPRSPMKT